MTVRELKQRLADAEKEIERLRPLAEWAVAEKEKRRVNSLKWAPRCRAYSKAYHKKNRDKVLAYLKLYREKNKDKLLAKRKRYQLEHPEKVAKSTAQAIKNRRESKMSISIYGIKALK